MIKSHPIADEFPMLDADQLVELAKRIKKNGLRHKGITFEGELIDGRNRQEACKIAGVKFETEEFEGTLPEAIELVLDENIYQRHIPKQLRAEIAAKLTLLSGKAMTQAEAAEKLGVSRSSVQRAAKKKKEPEKTSWTHDELKKDEELTDCFTAIASIYGPDSTRSIRTGTIGLKRKDIVFLSRLPKQTMEDIRELVFENRWTPKESVEFLQRMPDENSTNEEMRHWCLATKEKKFVADIKGFRHTCVPIK